VGVTLQAQGMVSGTTPFFEGDDEAVIDGELAAHGTGSEDFFNGGWYDVPGRWDRRLSFPLSGCLDYRKPLARSGAYRFFLGDACAYRKSLRLTIEHAPEGNKTPADYVGVTYFYSEGPPDPQEPLPTAGARQVHDLEQIVFDPGWNVPVYAFSMRNATLAKKEEKVAGENLRCLSMRAEGTDVFGPHYVAFQ